MNRSILLLRITAFACLLICLAGCRKSSSAPASSGPQSGGETLIMFRHGEKPPGGLGQLSCKGLNRALALPSLLIGRYGKPDFLFAPNPSVEVRDGMQGTDYSYIRPLATIEPTAIRLAMPVNAQIGYNQIGELQRELLKPQYAGAVVYIAWEHALLREFGKQLMQSYGDNPDQVPDWPGGDYETIYVFHITRSGPNSAPHATLKIDQEGLTSSLSDTCPGQP